jgi:hypothetical protein
MEITLTRIYFRKANYNGAKNGHGRIGCPKSPETLNTDDWRTVFEKKAHNGQSTIKKSRRT